VAVLSLLRCSAAFIVLFADEASAQCAARDVLNHLALRKTPSADRPPIAVRSADAVPVWKTITIRTFANSFALRNALVQQVVASETRLRKFSPDRLYR
jgi:hypothetical protein